MRLDAPGVAVIGCGYWGQNLVRNFASLGALRAVCDSTASGRARAAELAPAARVLDDVSAVLESDLEAVVVATPAVTHHEVAKAALLAGKDVFVEKPMALRHEDAAELVHLARERGRMLFVGHLLEYHPAIRRVHALVQEGRLGELRYVYSNRLNLGKLRREENVLWSFAPHDIAVILRLAGTLPVEVAASGGTYVQRGIADVTVTHLRFADGVRAHVFVSWLHPFKEQRLVVVGSKAMLSFDDVAKKLVLHEHRAEVRDEIPVPVKGAATEVPFSSDEPLKLECQAFLDAVSSRLPPLSDGESGLRALLVLQAAQRSLAANGRPVMMNGGRESEEP